jgi:molybdopterin molybdotransferase
MVKPKGFQTLTSVDEALKNWLNAWPTKKPMQVTLLVADVYGRVLAEDLVALTDLPRFDRSAMDGYAVKHEDLIGASQVHPVKLIIVNADEVMVGQAKSVWTGNPIPKGANAVVMLEDTRQEGDIVEVYAPVTPGINISRHGEDVKQGQIIAKEGTRLNPYHIGLAAALGISELKVYKKPKIAILATGNEVAAVGTQPSEHQVFDSNKITLSAMCQELGAETINCGIAKDNIEEISDKILSALREADALITTGGTSVGGLDLVPDTINKIGKPGVVAHGLALRPAMPTGVAVIDDKPVMIFSGNPVASIIGFEVFGRPAVCRLLGLSTTEQRPTLKGVLSRKVSSMLGRKTYVRVLVKLKAGELIVEPVSAKGPSNMSTMTQSNGWVIIPENREGLKEGESVMVQMFCNIEVETDVS